MEKTNKSLENITVIGLGTMGTALADASLKASYKTTVWNRTASKADKLTDQGATAAATVAEAIEASPLIIVCVTNYSAFYEILEPAAHTLSGKTVVNLTNGTPEYARKASGGLPVIAPIILTEASWLCLH